MQPDRLETDRLETHGAMGAPAHSDRDGTGTLLSVLAAWIVFGANGLDGALKEANAILAYQATKMVEGVPPYVSLFDVKAPLAILLGGAAAGLGRLFGADDLLSMRLAFLLLGALTAGTVYALGFHLTRSRAASAVGVLALLGTQAFALQAAWGPRFKTAGALFVALSALHALRRQPVRAGAFGACAALVWQPLGILAIGAGLAAWTGAPTRRLASVGRVLLGSALPGLAVAVYFALHGALGAFLDGTLLFHLQHGSAGRPDNSRFLRILADAYGPNLFALGAGSIGLLWLGLKPPAEVRRPVALAALLLPTAVLIAWSSFDFQGAADLFPLLPAACAGLAFLAHRLRFRAVQILFLLYTTGTIAWSHLDTDTFEVERMTAALPERRAFLEELRTSPDHGRYFQPGSKTLAFGDVATLYELELETVSPYTRLAFGMEAKVEAEEEGGVAGWLERLFTIDPPDTVIFERFGFERENALLRPWLEDGYRLVARLGPTQFLVRKELGTATSVDAR